ncbi:Adenine phosphoribosyltransferase [Thelohanellus kitauei]|uniref:adenine phosphoribosyltransferase n=1 Tax=Thelohanellus kitauei TaxID=669202 RepID=A0A0C2NHK1_THEKT|nr:Adenine phosphoribosyltransferase [Thelohanellus kitauei]
MNDISIQEKKNRIFALTKIHKDFPSPGLSFMDIMPIFKSPNAIQMVIDVMAADIREKGWKFDLIACIEARGFLFGNLLAREFKVGFVAIREASKLPGPVFQVHTKSEFGEKDLQIQQDPELNGKSVLIVDDLIATGGTAAGAIELLKKCGSKIVGCSFLVDVFFVQKVKEFDSDYCATFK